MKTHLHFLLVLLLATSATVFAQPQWQWAKKDGSISYANGPYAHQIIAATGGKALWGTIQNKRATYGQAIHGDYLLRELDSAGNTMASLAANGRFSLIDAQADASGNWYVLGTFYDSIRLSSALYLGRDSFGTSSAHFLFRLHAGTLTPDWLTLIGNNTGCTAGTFCISGSNIYVPMDSLVSTIYHKYDCATGARTVLWKQTGRSYTAYIQADTAGNVYVMGHCVLNGALNFNGSTPAAPASNKYPWYIARYRANGSLHWASYLTDITCNSRSFKLGNNNAVYLSGLLSDSTSLGSFHFSKPVSLFNADFLMARLDSNGNLIWAQQRPITSITQGGIYFNSQYHMATADTMLYMYCETQGASIWGNGIATSTTGNRHLATLVAYSAISGQAMWAKTIGGLYTLGQHIISDGTGLWVTGNGRDSNSLKFDTVSVATGIVGEYIPYIAKMKVGISPTGGGGTTAVAASPTQRALRIYPNPAQDFVMIEHLAGNEAISLRDLSGRLVIPVIMASKSNQIIGAAALPRGIYFLEISNIASKQTFRLALE